MILKSIDLENFMCYFGENRFEFSEGINVIIGDNGYGKSKLFDALYWVMYDKCFDTSAKEFRPTKQLKNTIISDRAIFEANDGTIQCSVTLTFHDQKNDYTYTLNRTLRANKDGNDISYANSVEKVTKKSALIQTAHVVDDQEEVDRIKKKILPDNIKPYMWFQGEQVENIIDFKDSETLTRAINVLSDISRFDDISSRAEKLYNQANKELKKKKGSLSKNKDQSDSLEEEREKLERKLADIKNQLSEAKGNSAKAREKGESLLAKLEDAQKIKELDEKRKNVEKEYNAVHSQLLHEQLTFHKKLFTNSWVLKGTENLIEEFNQKFIKYEDDKLQKTVEIKTKLALENEVIKELQTRLPLNVPEPIYVQKMLEKEQCLVCNREAKEGSEAYKSIASLINRATEKTKEISQSDISKHNFTKAFKHLYNVGLNQEQKIPHIDDDINKTLLRIQQLITQKSDLRKDLEEITREVENLVVETSIDSDKAKGIVNELRAQNEHSRRFDTYIGQYETQIKAYEKQIQNLDEQFNKLVVGEVPQSLLEKHKVAKDLHEAAVSTRERVFNKLVQTLEEEANKHYLSMTQDNLSARGVIKLREYNGNYTPELVDEEGNQLFQLNTGNIILIKLATIMAIISARKSTRDTDLYTLISDAPMSVFGDDYTIGFCKTVSKTYNQSIIMSKEFYKNEKLRDELLHSKDINLGNVYMITPNLPESERSNRNKLSTNIKALN